MQDTILELWRGNIAPMEHCGEEDREAKHMLELMVKNQEELRQSLTPSQAEILYRYTACADDYLLQMVELAFRDGFCLGTKLAAEALL